MPAMTAREFVDRIAVPTVLEFMGEPTQRRGYLACLAAYHVGDYLKPAGERWAHDVHADLEADLGLPFLVLQRMADAVKHREKRQGKAPGIVLIEAGSDTARPPTGFDISTPDNPMRFDDGFGGRWVEHQGRRYDMLDLYVIVLRAYERLFAAELAGSAIGAITYNPAIYSKV